MTSRPNFAAIIFDMDGLLVNSEIVWHEAEVEMVESRGHTYTDAVRAQLIGLRMDEFIAKLRAAYNFSESIDDLTNELVNRMLDLIPQKVKSQPGANEILAYVTIKNIPHAVASSSPMSIIDATIAAKGWDRAFSVRCSADDDANGKPAPDVYLRAARELGVDPSLCLALEDSPNGARSAVAAGMTCYAIPDRSHSSPEAFDGITEHIFANLYDVMKALQQD